MKIKIVWCFIYLMWLMRFFSLLLFNLVFSLFSSSLMRVVLIDGKLTVSPERAVNFFAYFLWSFFVYFVINALVHVRTRTSLQDLFNWFAVSALSCLFCSVLSGSVVFSYMFLCFPYAVMCFVLKYNTDLLNNWLCVKYSLIPDQRESDVS